LTEARLPQGHRLEPVGLDGIQAAAQPAPVVTADVRHHVHPVLQHRHEFAVHVEQVDPQPPLGQEIP